jgi:RNA polymerase sigma-70 factor (ECF subfamily)
VAYGILGDADGAVDATQDSFIKAYRAIGRCWGGSFKAWLLRIVTNTCYDSLRARKRHWSHCSSLDDMLERPESATLMRDRSAGPQEQAESSELRQMLHDAIGSLPAEQRTVVLLYDVEGFSYEEIAQVTGMPMGTVKSRLNRARARLRDHLLAHGALNTRQAAAFAMNATAQASRRIVN